MELGYDHSGGAQPGRRYYKRKEDAYLETGKACVMSLPGQKGLGGLQTRGAQDDGWQSAHRGEARVSMSAQAAKDKAPADVFGNGQLLSPQFWRRKV